MNILSLNFNTFELEVDCEEVGVTDQLGDLQDNEEHKQQDGAQGKEKTDRLRSICQEVDLVEEYLKKKKKRATGTDLDCEKGGVGGNRPAG